MRLNRDKPSIFTSPHFHRAIHKNALLCTDFCKFTYLIGKANFSINALWLFIWPKLYPKPANKSQCSWKQFHKLSIMNTVFLGLGKICLLQWEASRRTVSQHGPKTAGLWSRLNTSTSPFHTPNKEHCHSLSHNSFCFEFNHVHLKPDYHEDLCLLTSNSLSLREPTLHKLWLEDSLFNGP